MQSLQTWKSDVLCSREELVNHKHLAEEVKSSQTTTEAPTAVESRNRFVLPMLNTTKLKYKQMVLAATGPYAGSHFCQSHIFLVDTWMSTVKPVYKL